MITRKQADAAWELLREKARLREDTEFPYTASSVDVAYREASKLTHPDAGGSAEAFQEVAEARKTLIAWFKMMKPFECETCYDSGFIFQRKGWRSLRMRCPDCKGAKT